MNIRAEDEAENLISDFFTPTERIMLSKRLGIALLLEKGYEYRTIIDTLKVSFPTIASVNMARVYGKDGYRKFIRKIVRDDSINRLFEELSLKTVSALSSGTKGSGPWKEIKTGIEKKKFKRTSF